VPYPYLGLKPFAEHDPANAPTDYTRRRVVSGISASIVCGNLGLTACTTTNISKLPTNLEKGAPWGMLPIVNLTETPQAGLRAESIVDSLLRSAGVTQLKRYPAAINTESLLDPAERKVVDQAIAWAKQERLRYGVTGAVEEWRYKVGVDGEPAVGVTLQLVDIHSGDIVWSASGSKTGWSREALSAVAQKLLRELLSPLGTSATGWAWLPW
jgi:polysaccharide biosynthesis protein PelC